MALELLDDYALVWQSWSKLKEEEDDFVFSLLSLLFSGGRFGSLFDDDPKQWRMYADFIGSAGRSE